MSNGWTKVKLPVADRGKFATQALAAAEVLGLDRGVVKSQSNGFLVPDEVYDYLYPADEPPAPPAPPAPPVLPVQDPTGLSDAELEALTDPDNEE